MSVRLDETALGPRLEIRDLRSGASVMLDPILLAGLASQDVEGVVDFAVTF